MKKKHLILITLIISLVACLGTAIADETKYAVILNAKPVNLANPALSKDGILMLPVKDVFEALKANATWHEDDRFISCAYNNMFAKVYIDKKTADLNGNTVDYQSPSQIINKVAYAPLAFFCDFFALDYNISKNSVELSSRNNKLSLYSDSNLLNEKSLPQLGITMSLPYGWSKTSDGSFGIKNPYETYAFTVNKVDESAGKSAAAYRDEKLNSLMDKYEGKSTKTSIENLSNAELKTDDYVFYCLYYNTAIKAEEELSIKKINSEKTLDGEDKNVSTPPNDSEDKKIEEDKKKEEQEERNAIEREEKKKRELEEERKRIKSFAHYFFESDGEVYELYFYHNKNAIDHKVLKIFESGLQTIKMPPSFFSSAFEHYIEYEAFFESKMKIDSKLNSNIEVYDSLDFSGSVGAATTQSLYARISKGGRKIHLAIPISKDGKFKTKIFTPFGVGKHNVLIYSTANDEHKDTDKTELLKFSAINLSGKNIMYTFPSKNVRSDSQQTKNLISFILKESKKSVEYDSDYSVVNSVFDYMSKYAMITDETVEETSKKNTDELSTLTPMREDEANYLFAALVRAAGVPCKISVGKNDEVTRVFSSCLINGSWRVYDLRAAINAKNNAGESQNIKNSLIPEQRFSYYNYLSEVKYKELFDSVDELEL